MATLNAKFALVVITSWAEKETTPRAAPTGGVPGGGNPAAAAAKAARQAISITSTFRGPDRQIDRLVAALDERDGVGDGNDAQRWGGVVVDGLGLIVDTTRSEGPAARASSARGMTPPDARWSTLKLASAARVRSSASGPAGSVQVTTMSGGVAAPVAQAALLRRRAASREKARGSACICSICKRSQRVRARVTQVKEKAPCNLSQ